MLRSVFMTAIFVVFLTSMVNSDCPKECSCTQESPFVECNTIKLQPFGIHVFSLKITNPTEPLILTNETFKVKGLENVNTISIENATILEIQESAFADIPLLSTLQFVKCNIPELNNSIVFSKASGLRILKISNSTLNTFENVTSEYLEELVLSGNKLKVISKDTFDGLSYLTFIDLSDNSISQIDPLAFSKLKFLQEVYLSNNNITNLDPNLFNSNVELVTLDFSNNPLQKFDIRVTADLEKLVLKSCQLEEISQNVTSNLDYLSYLDISNNKLNLSKSFFNKMTELDYIDLSNNNLTTLDSFVFRTNYKLQKIILDDNNFAVLPKLVCAGGNFETYLFSCNNCNISSLQIDTFKQFPALVTVHLANNNIESLHLNVFRHMRSLIELDLSDNKITGLPSDTFSKSSALEKLNLAGNQIESIDPAMFEHNRVLKTLDLSDCSLYRIWNQPTKTTLGSLRQLLLANNNLTTITVSDLVVINYIEVLDLSNNPLQCDTNLQQAITWLNEHEVSPVEFNTHEDVNAVDAEDLETSIHVNWRDLVKGKCSERFYLENFGTTNPDVAVIPKPTNTPDDYHYGVFDSDEDSSLSHESDEAEPIGKRIIGMKISKISSSSRNKESGSRYTFLWPTLVFVLTSLSVLIIAANIMLLMLRMPRMPRNYNVPHIKIPKWNSATKLMRHSGSVYQPLSEDKYDSFLSITPGKEPVSTPIHQSQIP